MRIFYLLFLLVLNFSLIAQITIDLAPSYSVCEGESIQFSPIVSGGDGDYTFLWSPAEGLSNVNIQNPIATPASSTLNYTLGVTDGGGLQQMASTTLNMVGAFTANAGDDVTICQGSSAQIGLPPGESGPIGASYNWTPNLFADNTSAPQIVVNPPFGIEYTLTVSQNGCESSSTVNVLVDPTLNPIADAGESIESCTGVEITLGGSPTAQPSPSNPGDAIAGNIWSLDNSNFSFDSNPQLTVSEPNIFELVVVAVSGCTDTATVNVSLLNNLGISGSNVGIVWNDLNHDGTQNAGETGTAGIEVLLLDGDMNQIASTTTNIDGNYSFPCQPEGNYTATANDGGECTSSTSFNTIAIDLPASTIVNADCNGAATGSIAPVVTGGTPPYTYDWVDIPGTDNGANRTGLSAGIYILIVTDANGCVSGSTDFTVGESDQLQLSLQSTPVSCNGSDGNVTLVIMGGTAPYQFVWNTGDSTQDLIAMPAGTYSVIVIDSNGCTVTDNILVENDTDLTVDAGVDVFICEGESVTISASASGGSPSYSYSWSHGLASGSTKTVAPAATTTYSVTVIDGEGCMSIDEVTVFVSPVPVITATVTNISCNGANDGLINVQAPGGGLTYLWSNGTTTPTINNLAAGTYCVTVVDFNGCETQDCFNVVAPAPFDLTITGQPEGECDTDYILEVVINGGTPPFSYLWSGPDGFLSTNLQLPGDNLINGLYSITVTDANGCNVTGSIEINNQLDISLSALPLNCASGQTTINTSGTSTGSNFEYAWTGPDGFASNELDITVGTAGEYTLSVTNTDIENCSGASTITVQDIAVDLGEGIHVDLFDCNTYRLSAILPDDYFGIINLLWTLPDGSTSDLVAIPGDMTGAYTLHTSIPGLNCEFYSTYFVDLESEVCSVLEGVVRYDESMDCIPDAGELGLQNIIVTASSATDTFNTITDTAGYYRFNLPSDSYSISTNLPTPSWIVCEEAYDLDLSLAGTLLVLDIPLQSDGICPELSVDLSSWILRRCFTSSFYLTVCNEGTETALLPEVVLLLDEFINFSSANIIPSSINGQQINWTFDEIGIGECINITFWATISCDAELGQTHCSEAHATSYPFCGSAEGWSGANLELSPDCNGGDVVFNIKNTGSGDLNEAVSFIVIEDGVAMMEAPGVLDDLPATNETQYSFPANGSTYTFMIDQAINHPYSQSITSSIEGCGTDNTGGFSTGFVNQFNQQTATSASDIYCDENVGSYDPNDKAAIPEGYGSSHYIEPEDKINYRIRFQNTGTDTAFTVVIRDSLSSLLDIRTLETGASSHDYELDIFGEQILTFTFNNILLVDSFTNEPASNGFVDFNIRPKADAPLETVLENNAAIYFDFNDPVITNTVFHTLGRDFLQIVDWQDLHKLGLNLELYPNPSSNSLSIGLTEIQAAGQLLRINDANGRTVFQQQFDQQKIQLDVGSWPSSWYSIQLFDTKGQLVGSGRLLKQ